MDTNDLSALMQQQPDPGAVAWLDDQSAESIWISSITVREARYGLALFGTGKRKKPAAPTLRPFSARRSGKPRA